MTFDELSSDSGFLDGLRKGEYCLVLGAGFSVKLKNKTAPGSLSGIADIPFDEFRTIPLVGAYVNLTNKIFSAKITKGEAAANTWENNNFSINISGETIDLRPFYKDLFTLDEDWFKENELQHYKNILLPNWYQVYTFNFDNVFETIVKLQARKDFYSLSFPEHKGDVNRRTLKTAIHHLHGYIAETPPDKLTFSQNTYVSLEKEPHTLYDPFHVDIASGKKLVIIGNQFDERNIDKLFFDGLRDKNITIYHFSRDNSDFATKTGIAGNPNYHFIPIDDTHQVLAFFEKNKNRIENIKIDGADVINSDFFERIKEEGAKEGFTASDFYLAKQVDECQWYGVTQKWVIERDNYNFLKQEAISSFADDKRHSRISALVWGLGGSGKSTVLRQLGYDLCNEDFAVLWIKDKSVQSFYDNGLAQIKSDYTHKKFLVIIEDLYRLKQQPDVNLKELISSICSYSNVRLIVGDRKNDDSSYKEHIYNPDKNIVELKVDDNKRTLTRLLENIPDWKSAADQLLKEDEDYKSTLYYILWTIGRTVQKEKEGYFIGKHPDLTSHFRSLVESDLKALSVNYPGVAKMLYYWANIYEKNKIYIAYDLFFQLADIFKTPSAKSSRLILASSQKAILDIYSHKATGFIKSAGELPLFAFNHDILAEDGLSKSKLSGWHPFDDSINLEMLPFIFEAGDRFSSSVFLSYCLRYIPETLFPAKEKRFWGDELRKIGIHLTPFLSQDFYSAKEKHEMANEILSSENFWTRNTFLIRRALNISKSYTKANEILTQKDFWNLPDQVVCTALNITQNKSKANDILYQKNFWTLPEQIVSTALNISKNISKALEILSLEEFWNLPKDIVTTAFHIARDKGKAEKILSQDKFWMLTSDIVSTAMNILGAKKYADAVLKQKEFWNLPKEVVSTALSISRDKDKAGEILGRKNFWKELPFEIVSTALGITRNEEKAREVLSQKEFWNLPKDIVSTALNITKSEEKANEILSQKDFWNLPKDIVSTALVITQDVAKANQILETENFWYKLPFDIISTALYITKNETKADEILAQDNFWNFPDPILSRALSISKDETLKEAIGRKLFETNQWKQKWSITYQILNFYADKKTIPKSANQICNSIIYEFFDKNNNDKGKVFRYVNLMKIPLHYNYNWEKSGLENILKWRNRSRNLVTNTILAYRTLPGKIREMCADILQDWESEINIPIQTFGRAKIHHKGNHILLSLGHPDLRELAGQTAKEIKDAELKSPGTTPEPLLLAVQRIVDDNEFPSWDPKNEDEPE